MLADCHRWRLVQGEWIYTPPRLGGDGGWHDEPGPHAARNLAKKLRKQANAHRRAAVGEVAVVADNQMRHRTALARGEERRRLFEEALTAYQTLQRQFTPAAAAAGDGAHAASAAASSSDP